METSLNIVLNKVLMAAAKEKASNIHLAVGAYPALRIDDELVELREEKVITEDMMESLVGDWLDEGQKKELEDNKEIVFVKEVGKQFRLKVNFFFQKNFLSASFRPMPSNIPPLINLGLPKSVYNLTEKKSGLIIISGPYGSGRTTTLASMLNEINKTRKESIVTVEQPIEYVITNSKSLVEQREVGRDVNSFSDAIEYAQDSDVDVLAVSASQEPAALPLILEFANSGRLAFVVMETTSVTQSIEEILARFSMDDKDRAQQLVSEGLLAVISQRLVPRRGGGLVLAAEVLIVNEAASSLIREGRVKQIKTIIQSSRAEGMSSLDQSLAELVKSGEVLIDQALEHADDPHSLRAKARS